MRVRIANLQDVPAIGRVFCCAKAYMRENGNHTQWAKNYPNEEDAARDIEKQQLYVIEEQGMIHAVFAFIIGKDATYEVIEDGAWLNDAPYGTIHRAASDGVLSHVFAHIMNFCRTKIDDIRIDTHADNAIMRHVIEKEGFIRCGIIYVADGTPRIAYHYTRLQHK